MSIGTKVIFKKIEKVEKMEKTGESQKVRWLMAVLLMTFIFLVSLGIFLPLEFSYGLIFVGFIITIVGYIVWGGLNEWGSGSEVRVGRYARIDTRYVKTYRNARYSSALSHWLIAYFGIVIGGILIAAGIISWVIKLFF